MNDNNKRITSAMIVAASVSGLILLLFFLPLYSEETWIGDLSLTCANFFPQIDDLMSIGSWFGYSSESHYILLTLYLIPLFVLLTLIMFLTKSRRATVGNFIALCSCTIAGLMAILIFIGTEAGDSIAVELFLEEVSAVYWLMIVAAVGGIITVGVLSKGEQPAQKQSAPQMGYMPMQRRTVLACIQGDYAGSTIEIPPEGLMIGRDPTTANLIMSGGDVSRRHCFVTQNPAGGLTVTDYSSVGTFVDGKKLENGVRTNLYSGQKLFVASKYQVFEVRDI